MYDYVSGPLATAAMKYAVVDCGGVGYKCFITLNTYKKINGKEDVKLFTYLNVREDAMELYGFADETERAFFEMLISISGVGPKAALAILSDLTPDEFAAVLMASDIKRLTKISGVGPKMAQRVVLELKDKIAKSDLPDDGGSVFGTETVSAVANDAKTEAVEALVSLGYGRNDARNAVAKCSAENTNDIIKQALRLLSRM